MYYADYKKQVLQEYKNKLAADPSLLNLSQPSPAKLRKECAIVYDERYQRKDEGTLRTFFEAAVEPSKFLK
ncbi:hypothetical protein [Niabella hibiscisoli]|uniref:hypothetical protein n=1 Tax=Niabella hibiscisoli TaxID=1825928 RepID=UPI001F0E10A6|nr:hypothetical protein [Niabella hibiscisoli]MCH5718549.1 hypothetical protein [Niabella hibiscisoli]